MKKKLIITFLAASAIVCGGLAFAGCGSTEDTPPPPKQSLRYILNEDNESYCVSNIGTVTDTDVVIPSTYNGKPVTSIRAGAFRECTSFTNITIPDSITSIDEGTFKDCTSLTNIVIPDSITSIVEIDF